MKNQSKYETFICVFCLIILCKSKYVISICWQPQSILEVSDLVVCIMTFLIWLDFTNILLLYLRSQKNWRENFFKVPIPPLYSTYSHECEWPYTNYLVTLWTKVSKNYKIQSVLFVHGPMKFYYTIWIFILWYHNLKYILSKKILKHIYLL